MTSSDLDPLLQELGIPDTFKNEALKCFVCHDTVDKSNFGGAFQHDDDVHVICGKIRCYRRAVSAMLRYG